MKKTFLARRNAIFDRAGFSWGLAGFALALALVGLRLAAPNLFLALVTPVATFGAEIAGDLYGLTSGFRSAAALSAANEKLLAENAALGAENRTLLEKLHDLTGEEGGKPDGILAGVLMRPPQSAYDTYVIDGGSREGITVGMAAFGAAGIPLGVVSDVTEDFARVSLFSKSGTRVHAWAGEKRTPLMLIGEGAGAFSTKISRSSALKEGDAVFMAGPGAIAMGVIAELHGDPSDPAVRVLVRPAINPFSVAWVTLRGSVPPELLATSSEDLP